ncbi:hypothetical protein APHAL10511_005347 [Amanita phalloides]|nr:hypothetical protein APHAL10511_005347 [Amanita phalloides]
MIGLPGYPFSVPIETSETVDRLKKVILEELHFDRVSTHQLTLYKVFIDQNTTSQDTLSRLDASDGELLLESNLVSYYWPKQPAPGRLNILAKLADTFLNEVYLAHQLVLPLSGAEPPPHSDKWSPRTETVKDLYEVLSEEKLVYVRGSPASGKTTLMFLLDAHIRRIDPSAFVYRFSSWKSSESDAILDGIDDVYFHHGGRAFLLFDDAQDTYGDDELWSQFFKNVADRLLGQYHVITFCSYGSSGHRPVDTRRGTAVTLGDVARITLWPRITADGKEVNGLFLDRQEFNEIVVRHGLLNINSDVSQLIFDWTKGHVGAVVGILDLVSNKVCLSPNFLAISRP